MNSYLESVLISYIIHRCSIIFCELVLIHGHIAIVVAWLRQSCTSHSITDNSGVKHVQSLHTSRFKYLSTCKKGIGFLRPGVIFQEFQSPL